MPGDLSSVEGLGSLSSDQRARLARDGFLVEPSKDYDFFECYLRNPSPFVTSDSAFHAWHVLLDDALAGADRLVVAPTLKGCAARALAVLSRARVPADLLPARTRALRYLERVKDAPCDDLGQARALLRLAQEPMRIEEDPELQAALLVSLSLAADPVAWRDWLRVSDFGRFLTGEADDADPARLLEVAGTVMGDPISVSGLLEGRNLQSIRQRVRLPAVQDLGESHRQRTWRLLAQGATVKARAFDLLFRAGLLPEGRHVGALLGNPAARPNEEESRILRAVQIGGGDLHSSALAVLRVLERPGPGPFMAGPAWRVKTLNTQLGAWSEVEHDLEIYAKDNDVYLGGYRRAQGFHGYVEPVPEFYDGLRRLNERTREEFKRLGVFDALAADVRERSRRYREEVERSAKDTLLPPEARPDRPAEAIVATESHFSSLSRLLEGLERVARKELRGEEFGPGDLELLRNYGEDLKRLALIESNIPRPPEPISTVVPMWTERGRRVRRYAAVGRPLRLVAVVPYQGHLHAATGAIYSYYEFDGPDSESVDDAEWKRQTRRPFALQARPPWLLGRGGGLEPETWNAGRLSRWLADLRGERWKVFGFSADLVHELDEVPQMDELGFPRLDSTGRRVALEAWGDPDLQRPARVALFLWLEGDPGAPEFALRALSRHTRLLREDREGADSIPSRLWGVLSLRLLDGTPPSPASVSVLVEFEKALAACPDSKGLRFLRDRSAEIRTTGRVVRWEDDRPEHH